MCRQARNNPGAGHIAFLCKDSLLEALVSYVKLPLLGTEPRPLAEQLNAASKFEVQHFHNLLHL